MARSIYTGKTQTQMLLDDIDRKPMSREECLRIWNDTRMTLDWEKALDSSEASQAQNSSKEMIMAN